MLDWLKRIKLGEPEHELPVPDTHPVGIPDSVAEEIDRGVQMLADAMTTGGDLEKATAILKHAMYDVAVAALDDRADEIMEPYRDSLEQVNLEAAAVESTLDYCQTVARLGDEDERRKQLHEVASRGGISKLIAWSVARDKGIELWG